MTLPKILVVEEDEVILNTLQDALEQLKVEVVTVPRILIKGDTPAFPRILLVKKDDAVRADLQAELEKHEFEVITTASVKDALGHIIAGIFEVLLCDLDLPNPRDGFTVLSAMRASNPRVVTLLFTEAPSLKETSSAILLQADQILVRPMEVRSLVQLVVELLANTEGGPMRTTESVATILDRDSAATFARWLERVQKDDEFSALPPNLNLDLNLSVDERTGHLPKMLQEIGVRLCLPGHNTTLRSAAALLHGRARRKQGYSVAMIVEESRVFQLCIFETLQRNFSLVDFALILPDLITIADEISSQLRQTLESYEEAAAGGTASQAA